MNGELARTAAVTARGDSAPPHRRQHRSVIASGTAACLALTLGTACYPLLRGDGPAAATPLLPAGQLPALLHAFAFGVLILVLVAPWPRRWVPALAGWALLLCAAECLQVLPADTMLPLMPDGSALRAHLAGTFDPLDLLASAAGAFAALAWFAGGRQSPPLLAAHRAEDASG